MPRKPRFFLPNISAHIVQRGNNRQPIFFDDDDRHAYLGWLKEAAERWECAIHAYVLMTNHVHILASPNTGDGISRMMQYTGRRYVPYINHSYGRTGTLWEGRFKASLVQSETYLFSCYRYIELNPVRAGMVEHPSKYPWSSHRHNAEGVADGLITEHPQYNDLGMTPTARQSTYRELFASELEHADTEAIRRCLQTGTPLGNVRFRDEIEHALGRKVGWAKPGRPRKSHETIRPGISSTQN